MSEEKKYLEAALERASDENRVRSVTIAELRRALDAFGGSATALAKAAGVSPSTITRPLKDPENASLPKWATIVKILSAAKLAPRAYAGPSRTAKSFQLVEILGEIRPGVWFEDPDSRDYGPNLIMALEPYKPLGALSAFVSGPEGVPFPPGTHAIVDDKAEPREGDVVIFRRSQGELIETFAATYRFEAMRHVFYRTSADGVTHRHASEMLADNVPEMGILMGCVIATVWIRA